VCVCVRVCSPSAARKKKFVIPSYPVKYQESRTGHPITVLVLYTTRSAPVASLQYSIVYLCLLL
jgi:hypothetical protein